MRKTSRKLTTHVLRTSLISVFTGVVAATAIFIGAYIAFPLKDVTVSGTEMLPESEVEQLVSSRASLLTLNATSLENEIEASPWARSADVRRDWGKSEVVVDVDERKPAIRVSVDGRDSVLASDGTVLPGDGGAALPTVEIEGWRVPEVLAAARVLEEGGAGLDSVDSVGAGGIRATVAGRRVLLSDSVGGGQVDALEKVMQKNPARAVFDLRSPGRVVVSTPEGPEAGETETRQAPENPAG